MSQERQTQDLLPSRKSGPISTGRNWPEGYQMRGDGLYFLQEPELFLCQHFEILGQTSDPFGGSQGVAIAFIDGGQRRHSLVIHRADLAGGSHQVLRTLLGRGFCLGLNPGSWRLLQQFFLTLYPQKRCELVEQTGWAGANFVLPHRVFGADAEHLVYAGSAVEMRSEATGSLSDWQQQVAALCQGNSRLIFVLSLAFAAPLVPLAGVDAALFCLVGAKRSGKATALQCAASVFASASAQRLVRSPAAGLEAAMRAHRHQLLIHDDLAKLLPGQLGPELSRRTKDHGASRERTSGRGGEPWQGLILSASDSDLQASCFSRKPEAFVGQHLPLIELAAQAPDGEGIFESLHGESHGAAFAKRLRDGCQSASGSAFAVFLEALCDKGLSQLESEYSHYESEFLEHLLPSASQGVLEEVARLFCLVGFAGECASSFGITGWAKAEAMQAAAHLFAQWRSQQGCKDSHFIQQVLDQVRTFLETQAHRFERAAGQAGSRKRRVAPNLAGYVLDQQGREHHYVKAAVFSQEVLRDLDRDMAIEVLLAQGILLGDPQTGKPFETRRLPTGRGYAQRVYHLVDALNEAYRGAYATSRSRVSALLE